MATLRRIANLFRGHKLQREIEAELQSHTEMRIEDNIAAGMSPEQARRNALLRFGNPTVAGERVTAADSMLHLEGLARDIRYGLRQLRRSPGFALTAILTLALGVAANVVVFGVLNAILLRPLNVAGADRLFQVAQQPAGYDSQSYPDYVDYRARNKAFRDLLAYRLNMVGFSVGAGAAAEKRWINEVSGNYFDMLKVQPQLGRVFHASDEHGPNSAPYVVLSDAFWRSRFNADPHVVGTTINLNKHPFTIIGVATASFHGTELFFWPEFWIPMVNEEQIDGYDYLTKRFNHGITVIGALRPGVTPQLAMDDLNSVARQLVRENPADDDGLAARLVKPGLMGDTLGQPAGPFLSGIMLLALLVMVAACANLAGIFAARAADRSRELAIRLSVGSTRLRILRQVLTEALLLSVAAGLVGTLVACALLAALSHWQPFAEYPIRVAVAADARVYAIALLLSVVGGLLPGLLPARQIWRTNATQAMKGGAATPSLPRRLTLRDVLLCLQIALCALLVTASLVSLRGMQHSLHAPMGFVPQGAVLAQTDMHMAGYTDQSALPVQRRMIEQAGRIPGVIFAGTINDAPLGGGGSSTPVWREGTGELRNSNSVMAARYCSISPGYLRAAGTRLLAGRDFTWADDLSKPKIVLVNETFARKMFDNVAVVGRHFRGNGSLYEVVGVVEDGKYESLTEDPTGAMFVPLAQSNDGDTTVVVRSQLTPSETAEALNKVLTNVDPSLPFTVGSWSESLALVLFPARVATVALSVMGLLAAMLAVTGVFGMAAYSVSRRLKELGIRLALGSQRTQLMRVALSRPLMVLLSGSIFGLLLGVLASSLLARLVYQATPRDPLVLAGALLTMTVVGMVATWIPARRALAVDPAQLLRDE